MPSSHSSQRYGGERVTAACSRALAIGGTSYRSVDAILKNGLDKVPVANDPPLLKVVPIQHANLRRVAYYQHSLLEA
jgi:hypothetical protein